MSPLVYLVMYCWIPLVLYLFRRFPVQRALVIAFIVALLFLPEASFPIVGFPDYEKKSATVYGILLATFLYDVGRFSSFQLSWLDLPMLIWCVCPFASSISNGLGIYDGISATVGQTTIWGLPYFLGRIYLNNLAGLRQLAVGIFIGSLIYAPLCLYEIRMSPQLHLMVYGFWSHSSGIMQAIRYGGFRPIVFMKHGLEVGLWMMMATLMGIWLWKAGVIQKLWGIPMSWLVGGLLITFVLIKATGAYLYLVFGVAILFLTRWFRTAIPLLLLVAAISFYLSMGVTGTFYGERADQVVSFLADVTNEERASSVEFRFDNEELLSDKARQRMIFGWGGWGRNRVYQENWAGELVDVSITDSIWVITFGTKGLVGLISFTAVLLLPVVSFCWLGYPASSWFNPKVAPAAALAVALTLYMVDCTLNATSNPFFALISGGLSGLVLQGTETSKVRSDRSSLARRYPVRQEQYQQIGNKD